jgi:hypothetical protein
MAKCDLCGADCGAAKLVQLLTNYQAAGVVDICPDCEKWANKLKSDMLLEIAPRMRAAIAERKGMPPPAAPQVWWQRFTAGLGA